MEDLEDPDDAQWKVWEIHAHQVIKQTRLGPKGSKVDQHHLHFNAKFLNGETAWVQESAIRAQDPFVIIKYALDNNLTHHADFSWVEDYAKDSDRLAA